MCPPRCRLVLGLAYGDGNCLRHNRLYEKPQVLNRKYSLITACCLRLPKFFYAAASIGKAIATPTAGQPAEAEAYFEEE
ncbi:protein of unknown function [Desulfovibrio sp. 86]|nr:protein of unknown function [Desulfovibrio sp. 86]